MTIFSFLCVFVAIVAIAESGTVALGGTCAATSECSTSNAYCEIDWSGCAKGECRCKSGYSQSSTSCLVSVGHGGACDSTKVCTVGTCGSSSSTCDCSSGNTYNAKLKSCITTGEKAISEECSVDADCEEGTTTSECVANTGTSTPKYCRCKTGYITDSYTCRAPHAGDTCSSITCAVVMNFGTLFTGANQETETCQSTTCTCPSTADLLTRSFSGTTYKFCQTKFTGTKIAKGKTCTASNACTSRMCVQCPGDSTSTCVEIASNKAGKTVTFSMSAVLALALCAIIL